MREIKFRAWDKRHKKWITDFRLDSQTGYIYFTIGEVLVMLKDASVVEYTGLEDKNGKEIYEGDILLAAVQLDESYDLGYDIKIEVFWDYCGYRGKIIEKPRCHVANYTDLVEITDEEVIGNIYENSELVSNEVEDEV